MCRWAAYSGKPVYIEDIIAAPCHSLIQQSQSANECKVNINGDGFGLAWYGDQERPGLYRDILPAWSDQNLENIARMIRAPLFLAHVRASTGSPTSRQNCHPFVYGKWSFMHNGQIRDFEKIRRSLEMLLPDDLYAIREGSTDSELIFLLAIKNGLDDDPHKAIAATVEEIEVSGRKAGLVPLIRLTAAFCDGSTMYATRYSSDRISPTLYISRTENNEGYCIVSEPFNDETDDWILVQPNSFITLKQCQLSQTSFIKQKAAA